MPTDTEPRFPRIYVQLTGEDSNTGAIMARCVRAMRDADVPQEVIDAFRVELLSGDYQNVLATCLRWFDCG